MYRIVGDIKHLSFEFHIKAAKFSRNDLQTISLGPIVANPGRAAGNPQNTFWSVRLCRVGWNMRLEYMFTRRCFRIQRDEQREYLRECKH
jgi:hypothetical protein